MYSAHPVRDFLCAIFIPWERVLIATGRDEGGSWRQMVRRTSCEA